MKTLLLILVLGFSIPSAFAQQTRYPVRVSVASEDDKADIESYLKRELRSLGDVDVDKYGGFVIFVSVIKVTLKSGASTGYTVSYTAVESVECEGKLYFDYTDNGLYVGGKDELRNLIEGVVTDFDKAVLEKRRKVK